MYVAFKNRENKYKEKIYYVYLCESKRVDGKVRNTQRYVTSVKQNDIVSGRYKELFAENTKLIEMFTVDEMAIVYEKLESMV